MTKAFSFLYVVKGNVQLLHNRAPLNLAKLCNKLKTNIGSTAVKDKVLDAMTYFANAFKNGIFVTTISVTHGTTRWQLSF